MVDITGFDFTYAGLPKTIELRDQADKPIKVLNTTVVLQTYWHIQLNLPLTEFKTVTPDQQGLRLALRWNNTDPSDVNELSVATTGRPVLTCPLADTLGIDAQTETQGGTITCQQASPSAENFLITQPDVNKQWTDFPDITFTDGETVDVNARGCVQTGGHGFTWYRYVDPIDNTINGRPLYYGLITIPNAANGVRIVSLINKTLTIQGNPPPQANHLVLGYVDDAYNDNGYSHPDAGPGNQCVGAGDAQVIVTIALP